MAVVKQILGCVTASIGNKLDSLVQVLLYFICTLRSIVSTKISKKTHDPKIYNFKIRCVRVLRFFSGLIVFFHSHACFLYSIQTQQETLCTLLVNKLISAHLVNSNPTHPFKPEVNHLYHIA